jgi:hypothetical protein
MKIKWFQKILIVFSLAAVAFLTAVNAQTNKQESDQKVFALVNAQSKVNSVSKAELRILFLKQGDLIRGDDSYLPLDGPEFSEARDLFYKKVVKNSRIDMKRYWSRMIFTGKSIPPLRAKSEVDVEDQISSNQLLIGYSIKKSIHPKIRSIEISE